jgi:O-acetyl-ADP-ribose deacetylase (regulator of RNase III)
MSNKQPNSDTTPLPKDPSTDPPPSPQNLLFKSGDLLSSNETYIAHQCNCTSSQAAGLAKTITDNFPYAAPYMHRTPNPTRPSRCLPSDSPQPGTIQFWRPQEAEKPTFIGLFAQYGPGKPAKEDTKKMREEWFRECLEKVKGEGVDRLALPWGIGCGLVGGDWEVYEEIIRDFAARNPGITVVVYKFEEAVGTGTGRGRGRGRGREHEDEELVKAERNLYIARCKGKEFTCL